MFDAIVDDLASDVLRKGEKAKGGRLSDEDEDGYVTSIRAGGQECCFSKAEGHI
jgi:hypothetical protein